MDVMVAASEAKEISYALKHLDLIDKIWQCKVSPMPDLYRFLNTSKGYDSFRRLILRMEKSNILTSFKHHSSQEKYIYVNEEVSRAINKGSSDIINKETLFHDSMVSKVLLSLKNEKFIDYFALDHDLDSIKHLFNNLNSLIPDAVGISKKSNLKYAFEIEINQKSRSRVFEKLIQFSNNHSIDHIVYFFPSESVYKNYCLRLMELFKVSEAHIQKELKKRVHLIHSPDLLSGHYKPKNVTQFNLASKKIFTEGF